MSKEIEEMAKVIKSSLDGLGCGNFNFTGDEISIMFAKALYNAGYRKQVEGEWKITIPKFGTKAHIKCSNCGRNDTIEEERREFIRVLPNYCPNCGAKMKGGAE